MRTGNTYDAYENLAIAVVELAVSDYKKYLRRIKAGQGHVDARIVDDKNRCERFFRSREFGVYTRLNPEKLMRRVHDEIYGKIQPPEEPVVGTCRNCKWRACRKGHIECDNLYLETEHVYKVSWRKPCWEWEAEDGS